MFNQPMFESHASLASRAGNLVFFSDMPPMSLYVCVCGGGGVFNIPHTEVVKVLRYSTIWDL